MTGPNRINQQRRTSILWALIGYSKRIPKCDQCTASQSTKILFFIFIVYNSNPIDWKGEKILSRQMQQTECQRCGVVLWRWVRRAAVTMCLFDRCWNWFVVCLTSAPYYILAGDLRDLVPLWYSITDEIVIFCNLHLYIIHFFLFLWENKHFFCKNR